MTNISTAPTQEHQFVAEKVTLTLPPNIPTPKFVIGQVVECIDKQGYGDVKGTIVGMEYTSRDAALAEHTRPGWDYTIETSPFDYCFKALHHFSEQGLQLAVEQEAA